MALRLLETRSRVCSLCCARRPPRILSATLNRRLSDRPREPLLPNGESDPKKQDNSDDATKARGAEPKEQGPIARRLEEATEEALFTGGTAGRRAIEDAGFSEELKEKLLDKVQTAKFRTKYSGAFAEAGLSSSTTSHSSHFPTVAEPWTGTESQSDAVRRMLDDAKKPLKPELRGKYQVPQPVDLRPRREPKLKPGQRAASARDRAGLYTGLGMKEKGHLQSGLSEEEREAMKREFRDRFAPAARAVPANISALASLANERIEDAIARGQFKDIPRGKDAGERDARADNPFIDTTEYLMNKMIKRQDIVPPWIEKQQELAKATGVFRARLRNDWRRHAARMISSRGGSLDEQVRRAEAHARAEVRVNPRTKLAAGGVVPGTFTDDVVMVKVRQSAVEADLSSSEKDSTSDDEVTRIEPASGDMVDAKSDPGTVESSAASDNTIPSFPPAEDDGKGGSGDSGDSLSSVPFRDPDWEAIEQAYMQLSIENLNSLTRSYNLMAPELAKKPYFSLERELKACFADVAPLVAGTIRERAMRPAKSLMDGEGASSGIGSMFEDIGGGSGSSKVRDSKASHYGFKEFWRDIWGPG